MIVKTGSIWEFYDGKRPIVITTNIGWKKNGENPMGAGIAKAAAERYPELPKWYGKRCQKYLGDTAVCYYVPAKLFLFPTKPLSDQPWMSWKNDSDIDLIKRSTVQLSKIVDILTEKGKFLPTIGLPLPGCCNGGLSRKLVLPILKEFLDDRFILFDS